MPDPPRSDSLVGGWKKAYNAIQARTDLGPIAKAVHTFLVDAMRETGGCQCGFRAISKGVGIANNKTIAKAIRALNRAALIQVERGKSGQSNKYYLPPNRAPNDTALPQTAHQTTPLCPRPRTKRHRAPNDPASAHQMTPLNKKEKKRQQQQLPCAPAAAADCAPNGEEDHRDLLANLTAHGIGEPTRSRLAALPGITPEIVNEAAGRIKQRGGGTGLLVREIQAAVEAAATPKRPEPWEAEKERSRQQLEEWETERREIAEARERIE